MTARMKIKEVADASGFTTATLRYYEQIGLLPRPDRVSGRRVYGPDTVRAQGVEAILSTPATITDRYPGFSG